MNENIKKIFIPITIEEMKDVYETMKTFVDIFDIEDFPRELKGKEDWEKITELIKNNEEKIKERIKEINKRIEEITKEKEEKKIEEEKEEEKEIKSPEEIIEEFTKFIEPVPTKKYIDKKIEKFKRELKDLEKILEYKDVDYEKIINIEQKIKEEKYGKGVNYIDVFNEFLKRYKKMPLKEKVEISPLILKKLLRKKFEYIKKQEEINIKKIYKVYTEPEEIFRKKIKIFKKDLAFHFVLDVSGSMEGERIEKLNSIMNSFANSINYLISNGYIIGSQIILYNNVYKVYKPFNFNKIIWKEVEAGGGTHLGKPLKYVKEFLFKHSNIRNILITITDAELSQKDIKEVEDIVKNISFLCPSLFILLGDKEFLNFKPIQNLKDLDKLILNFIDSVWI